MKRPVAFPIEDEGSATAMRILKDSAEGFERLAKGLLEYETLTGEEIRKVVAGEAPGSADDGMGEGTGSGPSAGAGVVAIPKTRARKPKVVESDRAEPSA